MTPAALGTTLRCWYDANKRDLPWRDGRTTPWGVMVSEFMLQQTQVSRVQPVWLDWMRRWPTPADLADAPAGEAVRAWGRLGYPRRALRLHAAATAIVVDHGGRVPADDEALQALPGVGSYTAAAVAAFAYGKRVAVLDTNVRRVLTRLYDGVDAAGGTATGPERDRALAVLPKSAHAARTAVATMEFGALVCTARQPRCGRCPLAPDCAWFAAGAPAPRRPRKAQRYQGSDRQVRGLLLQALRHHAEPLPKNTLDLVWTDHVRRERALDSLLDDGLVVMTDAAHFGLPG